MSVVAITRHLKPSVEIDPYVPNKTTGLHLVCRHGLLVLLKELTRGSKPEDLDAQDHCGRTSLHYAAEGGSLEIVRHLVCMGASSTQTDNLGQTPLHLASEKQPHVAKWLLETGRAGVNSQTRYKHEGDCRSLTLFRTNEPKRPVTTSGSHLVSGRAPLHEASKNGQLETVERLLAIPGVIVDITDSQGMTPLHKAAKSGHLAIIERLVEAGANAHSRIGVTHGDQPSSPSATEYHHYRGTALHLACKYGRIDVVKYFLQTGPELVNVTNAKGEVPFHMAAMAQDADVAHVIHEHWADVNIQNSSGHTPLHLAVIAGAFGCVDFLLGCTGIDVNVRDNDLQTPLFVAAGGFSDDIFHLLWQRQDMYRDDRDVYGNTMYEYALHSPLCPRSVIQTLV
jgi:ankyrin repeat protein